MNYDNDEYNIDNSRKPNKRNQHSHIIHSKQRKHKKTQNS